MLLCRRIAHELMLSVTLQATLNKASLSLYLSFSVHHSFFHMGSKQHKNVGKYSFLLSLHSNNSDV